jgi:U3 small nucleolar ribonucleoprotein protein IMP4
LFPVPKPDTKRVITFANTDDFISFRHHTYSRGRAGDAADEPTTDKNGNSTSKTGWDDVQLTEVGPRFEMRPYQITLGTLEQGTADVEWALRPFMNTTRKRSALT